MNRSREWLSRTEICGLVAKVKRDAPLVQVALSGGEPLVRPDLPEIASDLTKQGLSVVVITNGVLLNRQRLSRFPNNCIFEITLFSADEALHNELAGRKVFHRILENVIDLRRRGHAFVLACVVTKLNAKDIRRTIMLGVALGAEAVMINRVNLSRRTFLLADRLVPTVVQLNEALGAAEDLAARYKIPIAVSVPIPPCVAEPAEYPHLHFGWCPRGGNDAYYTIGSTGLLRPCNHSSLVLGDLLEEGFASIVSRNGAEKLWQTIPSECHECNHPLKERCLGGCPAATLECYGDLEHKDPFIHFASVDASPAALRRQQCASSLDKPNLVIRETARRSRHSVSEGEQP